ncbi:MAG: hypothetical protein HKN23_00915 [Verrucomicrobiales bacterium]|nr:hypothetical protein [Verrucomicrobiales bacterium]
MSHSLIYPVATGRCGTVFLSKLLELNLPAGEAAVFHERTGFPHFGLNTPDASHFTTFNSIGNAPVVRQFFEQKLRRDLESEPPLHIEISHFLCKAGLIENLDLVENEAVVELIALKRDPFKIAWSFANRFNFFNVGFSWLFGLDPRYPNVIVSSEPFHEFGMFGSAVWYVNEMFARMEYYRRLVEPNPQVKWHAVELESIVKPEGAAEFLSTLGLYRDADQVVMPGRENATSQRFFGKNEEDVTRKAFEDHWTDPVQAGTDYFESGKRLSRAGRKTRTLGLVHSPPAMKRGVGQSSAANVIRLEVASETGALIKAKA